MRTPRDRHQPRCGFAPFARPRVRTGVVVPARDAPKAPSMLRLPSRRSRTVKQRSALAVSLFLSSERLMKNTQLTERALLVTTNRRDPADLEHAAAKRPWQRAARSAVPLRAPGPASARGRGKSSALPHAVVTFLKGKHRVCLGFSI